MKPRRLPPVPAPQQTSSPDQKARQAKYIVPDAVNQKSTASKDSRRSASKDRKPPSKLQFEQVNQSTTKTVGVSDTPFLYNSIILIKALHYKTTLSQLPF